MARKKTMSDAERAAFNLALARKLQRKPTVVGGEKLAKVMSPPRRIPTELRQEQLKYVGGPTGEDLQK